jgi:UDP-N-acetylmuramyl tripeptide synthase
MEDYTKAKKKLFQYVLQNHKNNKYAVFPSDDPIGRKRFEEMAFDKKINYSINSSSFLKAENIQQSIE